MDNKYGNVLTEKVFSKLFSGLCCSICKKDFSLKSIEVKERYDEVLVCSLNCKHCGKSFGEIILGVNEKKLSHSSFVSVEGGEPITVDDVIDAHRFIRDKL